MRITARCLATTSLVLVTMAAASPSWAADVDATSAIDTVTVYPDGATVTRIIALDLASGDSTLVAKDFPLSLDPSSLRVEGEAGAETDHRDHRRAAAARGTTRESARAR